MHQRQAIRQSVTNLLTAAGTAAGARVYATRMHPWARRELPAIAVYTLNEDTDPASRETAPRELTRTLQLMVQAGVDPNANVDNQLDDLTEQIEIAMHADQTFGGVCGWSLLSSEEIVISEEGSKPIGFVLITYTVVYYTFAPEAEDVDLADLDTVDIQYNLNGAQAPADQAHDTINNLET